MKDWSNRNEAGAAKGFLDLLRRIGNPDPAHLTDTSPNDLAAWRIIDFCRHPFVMDGAEHTNTPIGGITALPVRIAAAETYGIVVRDKVPAAWLVSMPDRVYQRCMFPFFGYQEEEASAGRRRLRVISPMRVTKVVTMIKPIVSRASLAEVLAGADGFAPSQLALAHS